jgi:DNA-binding NarL/FixJ family response regulator/DNA-binding XRE family transcriptional regulator
MARGQGSGALAGDTASDQPNQRAGGAGSGPTSQASMAGLGAIIAQARTQAGLSQAELADALDVKQSAVSQWEREQTTPTLLLFRRMMGVLGPWPLLVAVLPPIQPGADDSAAAAGDAGQQAWWPDPEELARLLGQPHPGQALGEPSATSASLVMAWRPAAGLPQRPRRRSASARPSPQELARLVAEGHSDERIGQRYQVTAKTVAKWRTDAGLHKQRQAQPSKPSREELARVVAEGRSDLQIGQRYGMAPITVRMWRYDYGGLLRRERPSPRPSPEELARQVTQGHSDQEIGQRYQVTAQTVAKWRSTDGLRRQRRPLVDRAQVLELRQRGLTATMIAAELGCSPSHVYRVASRSSRTRQPAPPPVSSSPDQPGPNASNGNLARPPVVDGDPGDPTAAAAVLAEEHHIPPPDRPLGASATREERV